MPVVHIAVNLTHVYGLQSSFLSRTGNLPLGIDSMLKGACTGRQWLYTMAVSVYRVYDRQPKEVCACVQVLP